MNSLPSSGTFLDRFGMGAQESVKVNGAGLPLGAPSLPGDKPKVTPKRGLEFRRLVVQYAASTQSESLKAVDWRPLAKKLCSGVDFIQEAAESMEDQVGEEGLKLWEEIMRERIRRAAASKIFRDEGWKKLEAGALGILGRLVEAGTVRDTGELLAIANAANRANSSIERGPTPPQGGTTVNVNFGGAIDGDSELPEAGARMTIDLSPRLASALGNRAQESRPKGERVIDGQMISAKELRDVLTGQAGENVIESTVVNLDSEGEFNG